MLLFESYFVFLPQLVDVLFSYAYSFRTTCMEEKYILYFSNTIARFSILS